jgi:ATP-dependent RNA helicase RhlE
MQFSDLGLRAELLKAITDQGYTVPTPIQAQAIPMVLAGRDVLAGAQTGTGKTAGFTLPILERLSAQPQTARHVVRALILAPTRELAAQVAESVATYGKHLALRSLAVFGGVNINPQIKALRAGVDVLIATPGRLLDHVQQKTVDLSSVEILVLDEADRMLDMGFIRDIRRILSLLPRQRQNLLFSATFSDDIRRLAEDLLREPAAIQVAPRNAAADRVQQLIHPVDSTRKRDLLSHLIGAQAEQVLVFARTKHGADRLARHLVKDGIEAAAIHGDRSQSQRTRALADFKEGRVRALVATDIAARGLNIEELPLVVNFELPQVPEDYVHRIGRTGRAGASGRAISLVSAEEHKQLQAIERLLKRPLDRVTVSGFEPNMSATVPSPSRGQGRRQEGSGRPRQPEGRTTSNPRIRERANAGKDVRPSTPARASKKGRPEMPALLGGSPNRK